MTDIKHTAGPWSFRYASDGSGDIGIVAGGGVVAECFQEIRRENEDAHAECLANARLIVASPDLFEAAKGALALIELCVDGDMEPSDEAEALRAAISKATGAA